MLIVRIIYVVIFSSNLYALIDLDQAKTNYPLVLLHGIFGFEYCVGMGNYWGNLKEQLTLNGATVYIAEVSQAHHPHKRGEQLAELLQSFGHEKYNIIAHSQGGIDARYVLNKYPHLVASLTTISTPHRGSRVADIVVKIDLIPVASTMMWAAGNMACHTIGYFSGAMREQDLKQAVWALTTNGMKEFNGQNPKGISEASSEKLYSCGFCCAKPHGFSDIYGIGMTLIGAILYGKEKNDGVVAQSSMNFGTWMGEYCGAHHLIPLKGGLARYSPRTLDEYLTIILNHVNHLKEEGL